jgi:hypothetical protein
MRVFVIATESPRRAIAQGGFPRLCVTVRSPMSVTPAIGSANRAADVWHGACFSAGSEPVLERMIGPADS